MKCEIHKTEMDYIGTITRNKENSSRELSLNWFCGVCNLIYFKYINDYDIKEIK